MMSGDESLSNERSSKPHDWSLETVNVVSEFGYMPSKSELRDSDVDENVVEYIEEIRRRATAEGVHVNDLLFELRRINSVSEGIPDKEDIYQWQGFGINTYTSVFGKIETAVELALASQTEELLYAIDRRVRNSEK